MSRVHLPKGIVWERTFLASFHSLPHNSSNELIDLGKPGAAFQQQVCAPEQTAHPDSSASPPGTVMQPDPASEVLGGVEAGVRGRRLYFALHCNSRQTPLNGKL